MQKYSVTQFNHLISEVIDEAIPTVWIEGEVSRFQKYASGHCYFTIKDKKIFHEFNAVFLNRVKGEKILNLINNKADF